MKTTIKMAVLALICAVLAACHGSETKAFIAGTYVNHSEGEYSIADDTLIIWPAQKGHYDIRRSTGYVLIRDGRLSQRKVKREQWFAAYDEATQTLTETRKGKQLTFYPKEQQLLVGKRAYHKIH